MHRLTFHSFFVTISQKIRRMLFRNHRTRLIWLRLTSGYSQNSRHHSGERVSSRLRRYKQRRWWLYRNRKELFGTFRGLVFNTECITLKVKIFNFTNELIFFSQQKYNSSGTSSVSVSSSSAFAVADGGGVQWFPKGQNVRDRTTGGLAKNILTGVQRKRIILATTYSLCEDTSGRKVSHSACSFLMMNPELTLFCVFALLLVSQVPKYLGVLYISAQNSFTRFWICLSIFKSASARTQRKIKFFAYRILPWLAWSFRRLNLYA